MSATANLRLAAEEEELRFGPKGELRESFGTSGRVHLDRWLGFLILHRTGSPASSIGRQVAVNSPAYLVWSPDDDDEAQAALDIILPRLRQKLGTVLLIELSDVPFEPGRTDAPRLPPFELAVSSSAAKEPIAALEAFRTAADDITIDLRQPEIVAGALPPPLLDAGDGAHRLCLAIPPIHRAPDGGIYPQMTHDLAAALIDSLLCAAAAYIGKASGRRPPHHRSLGRSAFLAAALKVDKKLDSIARSFDFLLSISPINSAEAKARFIAGGEEQQPEFHYRPLTIDPDMVKRELYAIDLTILEDMLLERLLCEKRHEIDMQLTMLATRNTRSFRPASMLLYGVVSPGLLHSAKAILESVKPRPASRQLLTAAEVAAAARRLVDHYRSVDDRFQAKVEVRDDVSGLLVSGDKLMIASDSAIAAHRLDPLLSHEVSVHLLTYFNGATQGLKIFRTGLAHYEGIQEGLGVFAEWAVGGLTPSRLRLLAGRVVAVEAMIDGAEFVDVYRRLRDDFGFRQGSAFDITARVFRSGGLAKDAIYLKGFIEVAERLASGASLNAFWLGKIAPEHVDDVEELLERGLLHAPIFFPEFLGRDQSMQRIASLREGSALDRLLEME